ncbi:MAG: putative toxin-antitoxin system toxin component, PIN family [Acidimicrobiia bacterium]
MKRVVVDPGVLVSAALSRLGNPARIVEAARVGRFVLVASPKLLAELDDALSRPKIATRLDPDGLQRLREVMAAAPVSGDPPALAVSRDPKDDYLIALAQHSGAACLISGDQDLTVLVDVVPPVRTPAAFLEDLSTW